jgi:Uma2 family endonuclease
MVLGEAGTLRFLKGLVRIPDVSFTLWDRLPGGRVPAEPIPELTPDLAVEVLSPGNTRAELARKLKEYFLSGVRVVWFVDPVARTVQVYSSPDEAVVFAQGDTLTGGDVLPGFRLPVSRLFEKLPDEPARPSRKKKSR